MNDKFCSFCGGGLLNILVIPASEAFDMLLLGVIGGAAGLIGNLIVRGIISGIKHYFYNQN